MFKLITIFTLFCVNNIIAVQIPTLTLNNGLEIPIVGFGTSFVTEQAIKDAIDAGYRHFDTSLNYKSEATKDNGDMEKIIGKVLKQLFLAKTIRREDLFIVSKLEEFDHQRSQVPLGIKESLANLGLDYLDMYLIHAPGSPNNIDVLETWLGMSDVLHSNLTRAIGVSNFNEQQLDRILGNGTNVIPVTNQVISNPYRNQKKLLSYLTKHNITLTAYSPLGGITDPDVLKEPLLIEIGQRHNVSAAQVALKYQVQRDAIVIPKANHPKYIKENFDLFSFELTEKDIKDIESLNKHE